MSYARRFTSPSATTHTTGASYGAKCRKRRRRGGEAPPSFPNLQIFKSSNLQISKSPNLQIEFSITLDFHYFCGMIKLTFLGTGTSQGVPMIACPCEVCHSTDPRDKRLRTSALLEVEREGEMLRGCLDFATERIYDPVRGIFARAEGGIGVPMASEVGVKSAKQEHQRPKRRCE